MNGNSDRSSLRKPSGTTARRSERTTKVTNTMNSYILWKSRHETATARFSSLIPHPCPSESFPIASVPLSLQDVAKLGMFGAWIEQRQESRPQPLPPQSQSQSQEPVVKSLDQILDRWIGEHSHAPGIDLDATRALGNEADRLLGVLVEDATVEVPESVTLRLNNVVEYMQQFSSFWVTVLSALVAVSRSDDAWRVGLRPSREIADQIVHNGMEDDAYKQPNWWMGAVGGDSLVMPLVGPVLKNNSAGWLIGHMQDRREHRQLMQRLADYSELVSLYVAKNQLLVVSAMVTRFLATQRLGANATLYVKSVSDGESALLLGPQSPRRWYAKPFTRRWKMRLGPLPAPSGAALDVVGI